MIKLKYSNVFLEVMPLNLRKVTDVYDMKVFTDQGDYFGDVEESIITMNKVFGWKIRSTKNSSLHQILGGVKGVIVPHQLVKAIGNIMIISKSAIPSYEDKE